MKLSHLHESFIEKARRPMSFGRLPVSPVKGDIAIIPVEKWQKVESPKRLRKKFKFISKEMRNRFVSELFDYEEKVGHHAMITVDEDEVILDVRTKDVDQITELDKEYAVFADALFKDVVYSLSTDNVF